MAERIPEKVIVESVEQKVELADETINKLNLPSSAQGRGDIRRTDPAATVHEQKEQSSTSSGQRLINLIWEHTQRNLAYYVIGLVNLVAAYLAVFGRTEALQMAAFTFMATEAGSVIGFYFGRTNHQKVGGVSQDHRGR